MPGSVWKPSHRLVVDVALEAAASCVDGACGPSSSLSLLQRNIVSPASVRVSRHWLERRRSQKRRDLLCTGIAPRSLWARCVVLLLALLCVACDRPGCQKSRDLPEDSPLSPTQRARFEAADQVLRERLLTLQSRRYSRPSLRWEQALQPGSSSARRGSDAKDNVAEELDAAMRAIGRRELPGAIDSLWASLDPRHPLPEAWARAGRSKSWRAAFSGAAAALAGDHVQRELSTIQGPDDPEAWAGPASLRMSAAGVAYGLGVEPVQCAQIALALVQMGQDHQINNRLAGLARGVQMSNWGLQLLARCAPGLSPDARGRLLVVLRPMVERPPSLGWRFIEESVHRQRMMRELVRNATPKVSLQNLGAMLHDWELHARLTPGLEGIRASNYPEDFEVFRTIQASLKKSKIGLVRQSPLHHYNAHLIMDASLQAKLRAAYLSLSARDEEGELERLRGQRWLRDPFNGAPLRGGAGGPIYSVGPNGEEEAAGGDDVFFPWVEPGAGAP